MNIKVKPPDTATTRRLINQINARLSQLQSGKAYSLESILGPDYWADEDDSHQAMGHCFSKLVGGGRAPFELLGFTSDRHNKYRYTG
ncbi:MAG: hypothetical protein V7742_14085 [Halioglobus sp.]